MSRYLVSQAERSHNDFFLNSNSSQRELGPPVLSPSTFCHKTYVQTLPTYNTLHKITGLLTMCCITYVQHLTSLIPCSLYIIYSYLHESLALGNRAT